MRTLEALIADPAEGPLELNQAAGWSLRLAKSLDVVHGHGRAHGAISAAAIVAEERSPFGAGTLLSGDGQVALLYRSPERGATGPASASDDRWAWAVLLHVAVTGAFPDAAHELPAVASYPALQTFLRTCFATDERDRPASAAALSAAMERLIGVGSSLGPLDNTLGPAQAPLSTSTFGGGRLLLLATLGLGLLVLVTFGALRGTADKLSKPTPAPDVPDELPPPRATLAIPVVSADAPDLQGALPIGQCLERVLGAEKPDLQGELCTQRDANALVEVVRNAVKRKPRQKQWEALGWYDLPAAVSLQARCCPLVFAPTLDTSPSCEAAEALRVVQLLAKKKPAVGPDDPALLAAAKAFGTAATCSAKRFSDTKKAHRATVTAADEAVFLAFFNDL